jgi:hypothetical protein
MNLDDSFNNVRGDVSDFGSRDSARFGDSQMSGRELSRYAGDLYKTKNNKYNEFIGETMSEVYDPKEKKAVFNHSLRDGVFNDIKASPLRSKMPLGL